DLQRAYDALAQRDYTAAIQLADSVQPWPGAARPGEIDCLKAEAYADSGDRRRAEEHYLMARAADPSYFWSLADLADFHADPKQPLELRRQQAAPYVQELRTRFAGHPDLPRVLQKISRKLQEPPT